MLINKGLYSSKIIIKVFKLTTITTIKYINYIFIIILTLTSFLTNKIFHFSNISTAL